MTTCLITGCEGFIGSHLAEFLVGRGHKVFGTVYEANANLDGLHGRMSFLKGDLNDRGWVDEIVDQVQPDVVFHLAAQSFLTVSWQNPEETLRTNVLGTFHLLEKLQGSGHDPTVLVIGSSAVYGRRDESEMPINEDASFQPTSMYAVSKVAEDMLGYFYHAAYHMKVIRVRPFNMTGPRKTDDACSDFAKGIAEIEVGRSDILKVGNLDTVRDFTDGRDAVRALWTLVERGNAGDIYNLCSGTARGMRQVLDTLLSLANKPVRWEVTSEKLRRTDDPIFVGSNAKLRALGWQPEIPFRQSLTDLLDFWRERVG